MDIIKKVTKDAERLLKSLKAEYYIKLPSGDLVTSGFSGYSMQKDASAERKKPKKRVMRDNREYGALTAYFKPHLDACKNPGDIAIIPFGSYTAEHLRGAVAAYCSVHWGKNTYTSIMNRDRGQVEIMRTAPNKAAATKSKATGQSKINGSQPARFRSIGHGMDALRNLDFDEPAQEQQRR